MIKDKKLFQLFMYVVQHMEPEYMSTFCPGRINPKVYPKENFSKICMHGADSFTSNKSSITVIKLSKKISSISNYQT